MNIERIQFFSPSNDLEVKTSANSAEMYPPLGLLEIATNLRNGLQKENIDIEVEVVDQNVDQRPLGQIINGDIVGVSMLTPSVLNAQKIINLAKAKGAIVMTGNDHATLKTDQILKNLPVDFIFRGDYIHNSITKLILRLIRGQKHFEDIDGLSYWDKKTESVIHNPVLNTQEGAKYLGNKPYKDIIPADRTLIKPEYQVQYDTNYKNKYSQYHNREIKTTSINIAQGCSRCFAKSPCLFCGIEDLRLRHTTPEKAVKEIKDLFDDFGYNYLYVVADDFTSLGCHFKGMQTIFLQELADRYPQELKKEVELYSYARADNILKKNILGWLQDINVRRVNIGFESGSGQMLKNLMKGITVVNNLKATKVLRQEGIQLHTSFVIGSLGESEETLERTVDFINEIIAISKINQIRNNITAIEVSLLYPALNSVAFRCITNEETAEFYLQKACLKIDSRKIQALTSKYNKLNNETWFSNSEELVKDWVEAFCKVSYEELLGYLNRINKIIEENNIYSGTAFGLKGT